MFSQWVSKAGVREQHTEKREGSTSARGAVRADTATAARVHVYHKSFTSEVSADPSQALIYGKRRFWPRWGEGSSGEQARGLRGPRRPLAPQPAVLLPPSPSHSRPTCCRPGRVPSTGNRAPPPGNRAPTTAASARPFLPGPARPGLPAGTAPSARLRAGAALGWGAGGRWGDHSVFWILNWKGPAVLMKWSWSEWPIEGIKPTSLVLSVPCSSQPSWPRDNLRGWRGMRGCCLAPFLFIISSLSGHSALPSYYPKSGASQVR